MQLRQQRDKILLEAKDYREKPATHAGTYTRPDAALQVAELTDPILREQESEAVKPPPPPLAETLRRDVISTAVAFLHNPTLDKVRDCAATSYRANRVCDAPFAVHDCTLVEWLRCGMMPLTSTPTMTSSTQSDSAPALSVLCRCAVDAPPPPPPPPMTTTTNTTTTNTTTNTTATNTTAHLPTHNCFCFSCLPPPSQ
jgi:hypothetical protein